MSARPGNIIFWFACGITLFLTAAAILFLITGHPDPVVLAVVAAFALLVWLARFVVGKS